MPAYSGTFSFSPSIGEMILDAYDLVGIRRTAVLQEHMLTGQRQANYWLSSISSRGPNLWTVDLQSVSLVEGTKTYSVPAETVMILDLYIDTFDGDGNPQSRTLSPLSRTDYAGISNKDQEGEPTSFWFDRLIAPTISLWPSPDANGPYELKYYRYRQVMDANLAGGQNVELPYLFLDAFMKGVAHRLSMSVNGVDHPKTVALKQYADEAWQIASTQNVENTPLSVIPSLSSYYS